MWSRPRYTRAVSSTSSLWIQTGRRIRAQPAFVWLWLVPAWCLIGVASLTIRLVPMKRILRSLGTNIGAVALMPLSDAAQQHRAARIGRTIGLAARLAPFRADCLPQALAAWWLCRALDVPCALHLGGTTGTNGAHPLAAHAWVVSGRVAVTGGLDSFDRYASLSCFVSPELAR